MRELPSGLRFALSGSRRRAPRVLDAERRFETAIAGLRRLPYKEYLQTAHWERVRAWALERSRQLCALCPATEGLQVHHRSYERRGFEQPEDVIVLCDQCHGRHHRLKKLEEIRAMDRAPLKAPLVSASDIRWLERKRA